MDSCSFQSLHIKCHQLPGAMVEAVAIMGQHGCLSALFLCMFSLRIKGAAHSTPLDPPNWGYALEIGTMGMGAPPPPLLLLLIPLINWRKWICSESEGEATLL